MSQRWTIPDKSVCHGCVSDKYLGNLVTHASYSSHQCSYCGNRPAASVGVILEPIDNALRRYFQCRGDDEEYWDHIRTVGEHTTQEALTDLHWRCKKALIEDVANSLRENAWVSNETLSFANHDRDPLRMIWEDFEEAAKQTRRYFFDIGHKLIANETGYFLNPNPVSLLKDIGERAKNEGLFVELDAEQTFYRARHAAKGQTLRGFDDMGPPPKTKSSAGRMNPAGISYFYLAYERGTAIGEIFSGPPARIAVGKFSLKKGTQLLDLTRLRETPSAFDLPDYENRGWILFLREFVKRISAPVVKDGREHVEYVPSQIVSEFFSGIFPLLIEGPRLDGMVYPSTTVPTGTNLVIFPPEYGENWASISQMITDPPDHIDITNWQELEAAINS